MKCHSKKLRLGWNYFSHPRSYISSSFSLVDTLTNYPLTLHLLLPHKSWPVFSCSLALNIAQWNILTNFVFHLSVHHDTCCTTFSLSTHLSSFSSNLSLISVITRASITWCKLSSYLIHFPFNNGLYPLHDYFLSSKRQSTFVLISTFLWLFDYFLDRISLSFFSFSGYTTLLIFM